MTLIALDEMTLALATEHTAKSIVANGNAPVFINTELTQSMRGSAGIPELVSKAPVKRLGYPNEIARLALWLASNEIALVTGQNIAIDGGFISA